ncbi:MAG: 50S ribosomal protein L3 [Planctomycetota bacterium]
MSFTLLGRKIGMTLLFDEDGVSVPVTVIQLGPCVVTQVRTPEVDGYAAIQIGFEDMKARNSTMPMIAHDAKARTAPKRFHREFRVDESDLGEYALGQEFTVEKFQGHLFVDVIGTSKGKGFQGGMKRHNFKGQLATHGVERKHRSPGSIASHGSNAGMAGGVKKGKRMAGHMGAERVTVRSLEVVRVVPDEHLILVKGSVPGHNKAMVEVRSPARLFKSKRTRHEESLSAA